MANDPSLALRQEVVTRLRALAGLASIVGTRGYGEQPSDTLPERPFWRYGVDDTTPRKSSCWDGATCEFPVHSFSVAKYTDEVRQMNALIAGNLDEAVIDLNGAKATIQWLGSTVLRDAADPAGWHGTARFRATV
jgi:hypothetical protein